MLVSFIGKKEILNIRLPFLISGNYWFEEVSEDKNTKKIISINDYNGKWIIQSNDEAYIFYNGKRLENAFLVEGQFYPIRFKKDDSIAYIYCNSYEKELYQLTQTDKDFYVLGNSSSADICYKLNGVLEEQIKLTHKNSQWEVIQASNLFLNNKLYQGEKLKSGDVLFVLGLKIIIVNDNLIINNPNKLVSFNENSFSIKTIQNEIPETTSNDIVIESNSETVLSDDCFSRSPRIWSNIEEKIIDISAPPQETKIDDTPFVYTIGPMMTMGLTSIVTGFVTVSGIINKTMTLVQGLPSLILAISMLLSMLLWPLLTKKFKNKQIIKKEENRKEKYLKYLSDKENEIAKIIEKQKQSLEDNNVSLSECENIILNKKSNLWERKIDHADFLTISIGKADIQPLIKINAPKEEFSLENDVLKNSLEKLLSSFKIMEDVPITVSLVEKRILGIVGENKIRQDFINGLLLRILAFHGYEDVKIVVFTDQNNMSKWDYIKSTPHVWSNDKSIRFFASNNDELKEVSAYLEKIFEERKNIKEEVIHKPRYLIITDSYKTCKNINIIKDILNINADMGFSLIVSSSKVFTIPNECISFISVDKTNSGIFENKLVSDGGKKFQADFGANLQLEKCCRVMANIPIDYDNKLYNLPNSISFLEMYEVGRVEQLNALYRWKINNPIKTLQAPVGIDQNGEIMKLDLHEKFHGPHGLIAGMTGSGKSEFIITYILSLAINYNPNEVSFVLIDYKGGNLAGALENKLNNIKLPHLAGTITNLDTVEMERALVSIKSELRRRQTLFSLAREKLNESTVDIYKYQKLYRDHKIETPIPHLFIICDEFAELKSQQPDFMDELISTARIGRSLGVHLILATQKPAGVVNDQIWSNSRFRVCFKVQEREDSMDMIKCPDAAALKDVGRFYLQVGYNELLTMCQSAWCGKKYIPSNSFVIKNDTAISFIDNIGSIIKTYDENKNDLNISSNSEELNGIVKYLSDLAVKESINAKKLWLDPIPSLIYADDLKQKYDYHSQKFILNPIIGEYDDPSNQLQQILTIPLTANGNHVIYGSVESGKDILLNTIVYSLVSEHTLEEVNIYILDFSNETTKMFKNIPQIGDVIYSSEQEKIENLFKMLNDELKTRKKLFADYNGDYDYYCQNSGKTLPQLLVIINDFDAFRELYELETEQVNLITREGTKYGIIFVVFANNYNSLGYKTVQNFQQNFTLQLNNKEDYYTIFGNTNNTYPSNYIGRGLYKQKGVFEFQTAYMCDLEKTNKFVVELSQKLQANNIKKAPTIKVLPEKITIDMFDRSKIDYNAIPIGISKDHLKMLYLNGDYINLIFASNINKSKAVLNGIITSISMVPNTIKVVVDAEKITKENKDYTLFESDFEECLLKLKNTIDTAVDTKIICVMIGFNKIKSSINEKVLDELFKNGKNKQNIKFILIDSVSDFKKEEYSNWYSQYVNNESGIWIGNGIAEQLLLKTRTSYRKLNAEIDNNFGYIVENGEAELIKIVEDENE